MPDPATPADVLKALKRKGSKYRSVRASSGDGRTFHSKKEARRYAELTLLQQAGRISGLLCQVPFRLEVNGQLVTTYTADFTYQEGRESVCEDVKSPATRRNAVYRIKKKLMQVIKGITIRET